MRSYGGTTKLYGNATISEEFNDGRSYNVKAVRDITQNWVENLMDGRVSCTY